MTSFCNNEISNVPYYMISLALCVYEFGFSSDQKDTHTYTAMNEEQMRNVKKYFFQLYAKYTCRQAVEIE